MWISKRNYNDLLEQIRELEGRILEYEDESGLGMLKKFKSLAKECNIETHGIEYQTFMNRMFMSVAGRHSSEARAYSQSAFLKDNDEDLLGRLKELTQQASVITKKIENKKKQK